MEREDQPRWIMTNNSLDNKYSIDLGNIKGRLEMGYNWRNNSYILSLSLDDSESFLFPNYDDEIQASSNGIKLFLDNLELLRDLPGLEREDRVSFLELLSRAEEEIQKGDMVSRLANRFIKPIQLLFPVKSS
jgi:hypothetical protein